MNVKFTKSYYQEANKNKDGQFVVTEKDKPMYILNIEKNYYNGNKAEVIKLAIHDLENVLKELKKADKSNDKAMDSWDSVSK